MLRVANKEDLLEFSNGVFKHFQFFLREPVSIGSTQCCQKIVPSMEAVLNFYAKRKRGVVHWATAFLTRCRRVGPPEGRRQVCVGVEAAKPGLTGRLCQA